MIFLLKVAAMHKNQPEHHPALQPNRLLLMGVVFQLPVIVFVLARLGFVSSALLATYRKHAFLVIMVVAAIITPPDLMTLLLVSLPLYVLYEVSIRVARWVEK